jgi:hypothetical protein
MQGVAFTPLGCDFVSESSTKAGTNSLKPGAGNRTVPADRSAEGHISRIGDREATKQNPENKLEHHIRRDVRT